MVEFRSALNVPSWNAFLKRGSAHSKQWRELKQAAIPIPDRPGKLRSDPIPQKSASDDNARPNL